MFIEECLYYLGFIIAFLFIVFSLDDLFWDIYYYGGGRKKVKNRLQMKDLDSVPRRLLAILIPAWNEAEVIGPMIDNLIHSVNYPLSLFHVFIGVYPNDPSTCEEVQILAKKYPNVHAVVNSKPGPTSKGQNLNQLLSSILNLEKEKHLRFASFIVHDAEDVIHPTSFKLANYLSFQYEVVQLPVFPLQPYPTWRTFFKFITSSTYADEFAENHYRGLLAREASGAMVPSAGTGFVFSHSVLDKLGKYELFEEGSITEDYKLSYHLAELGIFTHFFLEGVQRILDDGRIITEYIATREIFPNTLHEAVKQKSRWIYGISFQSFSFWKVIKSKNFSFMAKYGLFRDWKAKYGNLLTVPGYVIFAYFILSLLYDVPPVYPKGSLSWGVSVGLTFFMLERQIMRGIALKKVYGWRSAVAGCLVPPLLPLRTIWGNVINFLATLSAWRIALFGFPQTRPRWQKTKHTYLPPEVLFRYQRKLGDLMLEKQIIEPETLAKSLKEAKERGEKIGEFLLKEGIISQEELTQVLGEALKIGHIELDDYLVRIENITPNMLEIFKKYHTVPVVITEKLVILAVGAPLSTEVREEIKKELQVDELSTVLANPSLIKEALERFNEQYVSSLPRLGEKLLSLGLIQEEQLIEALRAQKFYPKPLGQILLEMGVIGKKDLEKVLKLRGNDSFSYIL
ncbi:MAG: phage adsorption protein NrfB [Candidatus Atribacteria bacterium]|nr:phage adsorption protein NrfB [Candidatus Atribacteria bacterium]